MNDLTPQARALLDAAKGAESPSRADRTRIKRGVLLQVAVLGATATATGGAAAMSLVTKITLVGLTVAAIGGGAVSVWKWNETPSASAPASERRSTAARRLAAPPPAANHETAPIPDEPSPPPFIEAKRIEATKVTPRRSPPAPAKATDEPPPPRAPLDPELTVLRQAHEDLRAGLPAQALRRLQEFDRQFGRGALAQERQAIMAIAHCQVGRSQAARTRAEEFLRTTPDSPLAARVRAACDGDTAPRR